MGKKTNRKAPPKVRTVRTQGGKVGREMTIDSGTKYEPQKAGAGPSKYPRTVSPSNSLGGGAGAALGTQAPKGQEQTVPVPLKPGSYSKAHSGGVKFTHTGTPAKPKAKPAKEKTRKP